MEGEQRETLHSTERGERKYSGHEGLQVVPVRPSDKVGAKERQGVWKWRRLRHQKWTVFGYEERKEVAQGFTAVDQNILLRNCEILILAS